MNTALLCMSIRFTLDESYDVDRFVDEYMDEWRNLRNSKKLPIEYPIIDGTLSSIFIFCDLYNPESDRDSYEFDKDMLRKSIKAILINNHIIKGEYDFDGLPISVQETLLDYRDGIANDPKYDREKLNRLSIFPVEPLDDYCARLKSIE